MAAMDMETTIWIKEERIDDMPNLPGSMFPEDLLKIGEPSLHVKKDPGLELHMGGRDCHHDFVEGPLGLSCSTDFTKEDPELNLEADGTENIVATSTRYESNSRRLIQNNSESCGISFEETVNQEVVYNELEVLLILCYWWMIYFSNNRNK
ncbi:uncharacterized protein LOC126213306 isoform X5 [Schistocerca nitens]|uniref:uncharacterized protein LOC126213306 isoform X5 n=1 Tax=Schistocerca nitens TaxID=7011 RepID=UPI002118FCB8|nr:uncharacterized protein LOC126213306 isoform X5 [Schistocerca nitens]